MCLLGLTCHQVDVDQAFPYADLDEEIFIKAPDGMYMTPGLVLRLKKALYGLKQAPRAWYRLVVDTFLKFGFKRCHTDHCLFVLRYDNEFCIVAVYVDDMLIAGSGINIINHVKSFIESHFSIKDLGPVQTILGINVANNLVDGTLTLSQPNMISKIVAEFEMYNNELVNSFRGKDLGCKAIEPLPMAEGLSLSNEPRLPEDNSESAKYIDVADLPYMRLIGSLLYLMTCTRPDIAYAVTTLSRFMSKPKYSHWIAALHVVRYLKGTIRYGITYNRLEDQKYRLTAFSDSDWASNDLEHRRSMTGYVLFHCGAPIAWRACLQTTVAKSSCEAEYYALSSTCDEVVFIRNLLSELGFPFEGPTPVFCDNKGAVDLAENPLYHKRTKHIDIKYHSIRELVESGIVVICKIASKKNIADIFTKPVTKTIFDALARFVISIVS